MRIGVPTEVKDSEYRVALTPAGVDALVQRGHQVTVQTGAGEGSAIADAAYADAGAELTQDVAALWGSSEMVLKVKEPVASEYAYLRPGLLLFTYLHLAANRPLTRELLERRVTSVAYETVRTSDGALPLLAPMSEIAGRLAAQAAAQASARTPTSGREQVLAQYPKALSSEMGGYYTLGRVFVALIEHPEVMRLCTRYGLPRKRLMKLVTKLLSDGWERRGGDGIDHFIQLLTRMVPEA